MHCAAAGIGFDHAHMLPRWYFFNDPEAMERCEYAVKVNNQAVYLAQNYSVKADSLIAILALSKRDRDGTYMRMLTVVADHDSAYGQK